MPGYDYGGAVLFSARRSSRFYEGTDASRTLRLRDLGRYYGRGPRWLLVA